MSVPMAPFSRVFRCLFHLHLAAQCSGDGHRKRAVCRLSFNPISSFMTPLSPSLGLVSPSTEPHWFYFWSPTHTISWWAGGRVAAWLSQLEAETRGCFKQSPLLRRLLTVASLDSIQDPSLPRAGVCEELKGLAFHGLCYSAELFTVPPPTFHLSTLCIVHIC